MPPTGAARAGPVIPPELTARVLQPFRLFFELRGDAAKPLEGVDLTNELGAALMLTPNHEPRSAQDAQSFMDGTWELYDGLEATTIEAVKSSVLKAAGGVQPVRLAVVPIVYSSPERGFSLQLPLFRVETPRGEQFVDNLGRRYASFQAWRLENKLPPGWVTYPPRGHLTSALPSRPEPTHAVIDTTWERLADWGETAGIVAGFAVGTAALIAPGVPLIIGCGVAVALWYATQSIRGLVDAWAHDESLNPLVSSDARTQELKLLSSLFFTSAAAGRRLFLRETRETGSVTSLLGRATPALAVGGQVTSTVAAVNRSADLLQHWDMLTNKQRMALVAYIVFFATSARMNGARKGGIKNLYSVAAALQHLKNKALNSKP